MKQKEIKSITVVTVMPEGRSGCEILCDNVAQCDVFYNWDWLNRQNLTEFPEGWFTAKFLVKKKKKKKKSLSLHQKNPNHT